MAGLLAHLLDMAGRRGDLLVEETGDIDAWGFLLFRDGRYHLYINRDIRDFRKTMILVDELGHYVFRRRHGGGEEGDIGLGERIARDRRADAYATRYARKLLYMVRRGLHGKSSRRPRQGAYDPAWRLPVKGA